MYPSSAQAYQSLQDYSSKRRSTADIQKEAEDKYNVSGISSRLSNLRTLVGNLENSVEQVDPSVTGRLQGGFATEAQRQTLVNRERAPILGDLSKQQSALGNEQQQFSLSSSLASDLAHSLRSDDETGYQRLLDQYNAATAKEQSDESKRQYEASLAEQRRQFDEQQRAAQAKGTGTGYDLSGIINGLTGSGAQAAPSGTDPITQTAYNELKSMASRRGKDNASIQREYAAIQKSAGYGNPKDKVKLQLIDQLYPWVKDFGKPVSLSGSLGGSTVRLQG